MRGGQQVAAAGRSKGEGDLGRGLEKSGVELSLSDLRKSQGVC